MPRRSCISSSEPVRKLRNLLLACLGSLVAYLAVHALLLDRPITHGALEAALRARLERAARVTRPKLVILAGSNAPYSHRCAVIGAALGMDCVNGGVAVGIGLDYLFARWDGLLRPGDAVYLPMEPAQYVRSRLATATGPDAAIMARGDRITLAGLGPERWLGAAFAIDLRGVVMAGLEMALARVLPARAAEATNEWGDRVGHAEADAATEVLRGLSVRQPEAEAITGGHGSWLIGAFTRLMTARGVRVVGGLSTGFADAPLDGAAVAAIAAVYEANGGVFVALDNFSRYPRAAFFDGREHLSEPFQIAHSRMLAVALAHALGRPMGHRVARDIARERME
jgi:hypothetical protein